MKHRQNSQTSLLGLDEPADLSGIGHVPLKTQPQIQIQIQPLRPRKAKRKRVSVLRDELSNLTAGDEASAKATLENLYELAKMSHSSDRFFVDFGKAHGIQTVLEYLSGCSSSNINNSYPASGAGTGRVRRGTGTGRQPTQRLGDPDCVRTAANLAYLCIMRGPKAKSNQISDAFVEHKGVEIFRKANARFVLGIGGDENSVKNKNNHKNKQKNKRSEAQKDDGDHVQENSQEDRYAASSAIWLALGMVFCKSGGVMKKEQHMASIDAILDSMDKLGDVTNQAREQLNRKNGDDTDDDSDDDAISSKTCLHATKALHGVYRALNYLIDHVSMTKDETDSRRLFQRCHAVAKIPAQTTIATRKPTTKSKKRTIPDRYKTDDATLFLNTKIFFVACFQNGLLRTRVHFEEAVPLCVETILRNSSKASKNVRAQDRRHCVFDLMVASCRKVHKTTLETSGILGAIEATLLAEGTVKSSSKTKARELLKAIVVAM